MNIEYLKTQQKQWDEKARIQEELEIREEEKRLAKMEAEAREKAAAEERQKRLLQEQEFKRLRQVRERKEQVVAEQKWENQCDILVSQIKERIQRDKKLEEIKLIVHHREPSLQELDWHNWLLSDPLHQRLAELDIEVAMELFKRDNLLARMRKPTRGKKRQIAQNYALAFSGDRSGAADSYAETTFNPDNFSLWNGFTISFWVRPDEEMNQKSVILGTRASSPVARFHFGFSGTGTNNIGVGVGGNDVTGINNPMEVGRWYNWVISYTGTQFDAGERKLRMWINTDARMTSNNSTAWNNQDEATESYTHGIYFGGRNTEGSGYTSGFACALDEVAIYNRCIDSVGTFANEVYNGRSNYDHLKNGESGLVGYWKFNEGNGTTIIDHSGNGNHGTFGAISGNTTAFPVWVRTPKGYGQQ